MVFNLHKQNCSLRYLPMPVECTICVVVFRNAIAITVWLALVWARVRSASWVQISRLQGLHMRSVRVLEYQLMLSGACSSAAEHSSDTGLAARELESARDQPTERVILRFRLSLSLSLSNLYHWDAHETQFQARPGSSYYECCLCLLWVHAKSVNIVPYFQNHNVPLPSA